MDFWDLLKLILRRWYFALPALFMTVLTAVLTSASVRPNYICTAYVQLVPPTEMKAAAGSSPLAERNPWIALGLAALANAAQVSLNEESFAKTLDAGGYSRSYSLSLSSTSPLLSIEVVGADQSQALGTARQMVSRYEQAVKDLQSSNSVAADDFILAQRVDSASADDLVVSDSNRKRALVAVTGVGLLLTMAWTIGLDAMLRRRARRRYRESDELHTFLGPAPRPAAPPTRYPSSAGGGASPAEDVVKVSRNPPEVSAELAPAPDVTIVLPLSSGRSDDPSRGRRPPQ